MNYLEIIYSLITKSPFIIPPVILVILLHRLVKLDEQLIDEAIWLSYSIGIAILYFIAIKSFESHNDEGLLKVLNQLFINIIKLFYSILYSYFMLDKDNKKRWLIASVSFTLLPIAFNFVEEIFDK